MIPFIENQCHKWFDILLANNLSPDYHSRLDFSDILLGSQQRRTNGLIRLSYWNCHAGHCMFVISQYRVYIIQATRYQDHADIERLHRVNALLNEE